MLRLRPSATTERLRRSTKGAVYEPVDKSRLLLMVAMNDAASKLKLITLKFEGKFLGP